MIQFRDVNYKDKEKIYEFYAKSGSLGTNYSIATLCGWQKCNELQIYFNDEYLILKINKPGSVRFLSPLADSLQAYSKAIDRIIEFADKKPVTIVIASSEQVEVLQEKGFECENIRAHAEYLYQTESLITLKGKKYNSKRNFVNNFPVPYNFREYQEQDFGAVMELFAQWKEGKVLEDRIDEMDKQVITCEWERQVAQSILADMDKYNTFADVLEVEGSIAGFCLGEILPTDVGAIYFQKANIAYRGIYPLLDNLFIKKHFTEITYVNKQEDMGLEGLRKSKLSYHPYMLVERWRAIKS